MVRVVTVWPGVTVHSVFFTSCVRLTRFGLAAAALTVLAFADFTMAGRGSGFSAT